MKKPYVPFIAFLVLLLLTIPISFDFADSPAPGWHVTIVPMNFVLGLLTAVILIFVIIAYWLLLRKVEKVNLVLFCVHFILTISSGTFLKFPTVFFDTQHRNENEVITELALRIRLIPVAWIVFAAGQILFIIYYIRTIRPGLPRD